MKAKLTLHLIPQHKGCEKMEEHLERCVSSCLKENGIKEIEVYRKEDTDPVVAEIMRVLEEA